MTGLLKTYATGCRLGRTRRGPDEEYEEYGRDEAIDAAQRHSTKSFFKTRRNEKPFFYVMQLEVMFERKHYHWITYKAIDELVDEGSLADDIKPLIQEDEPRPGSPKVRFIFHPSCRSTTRQINRKLTLIRRFSAEDVSRGAGRFAGILFSRGLMMNGFTYVGENLREYRDRKWTISNSDLDYLFERDDRAYGCKIKNRFGYMKRDENHRQDPNLPPARSHPPCSSYAWFQKVTSTGFAPRSPPDSRLSFKRTFTPKATGRYRSN
jgi:hypothetical protein